MIIPPGQNVLKKTAEERTGERSLEVSKWQRENLKNSHTGLSISDIDAVFHEYNQKRLILVEYKTFNRVTTFAQRQMFEVIDECLRIGASKVGYDYRGFYLVRLSGKCPKTSRQITISKIGTLKGEMITEEELIKFLDFSININL